MKQSIVRLDEPALLALGMSKVNVEMLRNIVRVTGKETDSPTVPDVAQQADTTSVIVVGLSGEIDMLKTILSLLESNPVPLPPDTSLADALSLMPVPQLVQAVEFMQTEVRQLAERLAQVTEHFTTEVRQLADQQIVNANLIQELKQGTML